MLHVLDLVVNAVEAGAGTIRVVVDEDPDRDRLTIRAADNGRGMSPGLLDAVLGRLRSARPGRRRPIGLGLALLRQTAEMCGGCFRVVSRPGRGTLVTARMRYDHIDRPPLGDFAGTAFDLVIGNPRTGLRLTHRRGDRAHTFDSRSVRRALGDAGLLQSPEVMRWVRRQLEEGERGLE